MKNKKPAGVVMVAIYSAFSGVITLFSGFLMLMASVMPELPLWITVIGLVFTVFGVVLLAATYGLWTLQAWGWSFARWLYIIAIPLGVISIFPIYPDSEMTSANTILQVFGIVLALVIVRYLSTAKVRELYGIGN
ncbi:MAG: hypothetical protein L3J24_14295 [Xanthomonadales bacterium]|nr:hypothetical protein [Xanthomonadales bacterium]